MGDGEPSTPERGCAGAEGGSVGAAGDGRREGCLEGGCGRGNRGSWRSRRRRQDGEKQVAALGEQAFAVADG